MYVSFAALRLLACCHADILAPVHVVTVLYMICHAGLAGVALMCNRLCNHVVLAGAC